MIKKELQQELNRTKLILDYAREEIKEKDNEIERLKDLCNKYEEEHKIAFEEWKKAINIINEFEDFITDVDSHINLGDESEEFILVRDKWLELQELKGVDKE